MRGGKGRRGPESNQPPRRPSTDDDTVTERRPSFTVSLPVWVVEDANLGERGALHVAAAIESMTDDTGVYRGGLRTVARRLKMSEGMTGEYFRRLQRAGYLRYYGRAGGWVLRWNQWRAVATDEVYEWADDLVALDEVGDQRELQLPVGVDLEGFDETIDETPFVEATDDELAAMTAYQRRVYEFNRSVRRAE